MVMIRRHGRDRDYVTELRRPLAIPPGSVSGTMTITITPINDKKVEGDETIRLRGSYPNNQVTVQDAEGDDVKLTVVPVDMTLQDTGADGASFFAADTAIADQTYSVGIAIADLVLPEASGWHWRTDVRRLGSARRACRLTPPRGRLRAPLRQ